MTGPDATRREFLEIAVVAGGALAGGQLMPGAMQPAAAQDTVPTPPPLEVILRVNGTEHRLTLDPRTTLLDALREHLHLTGSKKGCGLGQCGACTVLMDGKRVKSCLSLAALVEGREITTIEGLAQGEQLHPLQAAFIERDAFQCGYCTPGQIMAGVACIAEGHAGSAEEIRAWMSGNLCRCGAYDHIVAAIQDAAQATDSVRVVERCTLHPRTPTRLVRRSCLRALRPAATTGRPNTSPGGTHMVAAAAGKRAPARAAGEPRRPSRRSDRDRDRKGLRIGAAATMADVAAHPAVVEQFPVIAEALLEFGQSAGAQSGDDRRQPPAAPRCPYFRDVGIWRLQPALRRAQVARQTAAENRWHAVLGRRTTASPRTLRTWQSRWLRSTRPRVAGARRSARGAARRLLPAPGDTPHIETVLEPGEVITAITGPGQSAARRSHYLKVRDRASFEFALVSAAVALDLTAAHARGAGRARRGRDKALARSPGRGALAGASSNPGAPPRGGPRRRRRQGYGHNDFKIELKQRVIVRAIETTGART